MIGGAGTESVRIAYEYLQKTQTAAIAFSQDGFSIEEEIFINAIALHALDYDDIDLMYHVQPSTMILPVVYAICDQNHLTGRDLVEAYILGTHILRSIAAGLNDCSQGITTTSVVGIFAAAAVAGKLMGLDRKQLVNALGIAGGFSSGLKANFGTEMKDITIGSAAVNGYRAAKLAKAGVTAAPDIFENPNGFSAVMNPFYDFHAAKEFLMTGLGQPSRETWHHKSYAASMAMIPAIEAAKRLREQNGIRPEQIKKVRCNVSAVMFNVNKFPFPKNIQQTKFSLPYCISLALTKERITAEDFNTETAGEDVLRADIMKRIYIFNAIEEEESNPYIVEMSLETEDGEKYFTRVEKIEELLRHACNPEKVKGKFWECCKMGNVPIHQVEKLFGVLQELSDENDVACIANVLKLTK